MTTGRINQVFTQPPSTLQSGATRRSDFVERANRWGKTLANAMWSSNLALPVSSTSKQFVISDAEQEIAPTCDAMLRQPPLISQTLQPHLSWRQHCPPSFCIRSNLNIGCEIAAYQQVAHPNANLDTYTCWLAQKWACCQPVYHYRTATNSHPPPSTQPPPFPSTTATTHSRAGMSHFSVRPDAIRKTANSGGRGPVFWHRRASRSTGAKAARNDTQLPHSTFGHAKHGCYPRTWCPFSA